MKTVLASTAIVPLLLMPRNPFHLLNRLIVLSSSYFTALFPFPDSFDSSSSLPSPAISFLDLRHYYLRGRFSNLSLLCCFSRRHQAYARQHLILVCHLSSLSLLLSLFSLSPTSISTPPPQRHSLHRCPGHSGGSGAWVFQPITLVGLPARIFSYTLASDLTIFCPPLVVPSKVGEISFG